MIDYQNSAIQKLIENAMHSMMVGGDLRGIDYTISRIVGLHDPMPFTKNEDVAAILLTDVFGAAGLATEIVITETSAGNFICEVENGGPDNLVATAEHSTRALSIVAALVFAMAEAIEIMA